MAVNFLFRMVNAQKWRPWSLHQAKCFYICFLLCFNFEYYLRNVLKIKTICVEIQAFHFHIITGSVQFNITNNKSISKSNSSLDCVWNVSVPAGRVIAFKYVDLDLELSNDCIADFVVHFVYRKINQFWKALRKCMMPLQCQMSPVWTIYVEIRHQVRPS